MEGTPFGRYRLIELLGRGGMGEVWRAHDTSINNRTVAIKLLPPQFAANETFVARFRREADAAAQLNNPHVIPIHTYGEIDGRLYVDMRLIEGRDLQQMLADGPLELARAVRIIEQVAKALHAAHKIGLVHRDVKPSNILIDDDDFAYLIDFGIARAADESRLTSTGAIVGSWPYMSPERLRAGQADARSDIYALACVLFECLTGSTPYPGDSFEQQITAHLMEPPPRPSSTDHNVPVQVDAVIAKGMAKEPDRRFATTVELAHAARDAISAPIQRSTQYPAHHSGTGLAHTLAAQPRTVIAASPGPVPPAWPPPPAPTPTSVGRTGRGITVALVAGAVALVAVIAAAVVFLTPPKHPPPSESPPPKPRSYGAQVELLSSGGVSHPDGVAVDATGTLYVADEGTKRVLKLAAGSSVPTSLPFVYSANDPISPNDVAVDATGAVYVADSASGKSRVVKLAAGSSTATPLPFIGFEILESVAPDTAGNVYVTDMRSNQVLKLAKGSSTPTAQPFTGLNSPHTVAVDTAGNLYVTDRDNNRVLKLPTGSSTPTVLPFTGLNSPTGAAVDTAGNLYIADEGNNRLLELPADSSDQRVLPFTGLNHPRGVAVDPAGNVYVADYASNRVLKLPVQ